MQDAIKETMYFDELGVNDLSEQIGLGRLKSQSKETEVNRDRSSEFKPKFSLGALSRLFGGPELGIEGSYRRIHSEKEITREELAITGSDHLHKIIETLGGVASLKMTLDRAWHLSLAKESGIFCMVVDRFRTVPTLDPETWLDVANRAKILQLVDVSTCQFRIGMSLGKMLGVKDETINPASHLAHRLGNTEVRAVSLAIFGNMDTSRYIKPYTVYWA